MKIRDNRVPFSDPDLQPQASVILMCNQNGDPMIKQCDNCGESFVPREAKVRFCCPSCNQEWWVNRRRQDRALALQYEREQEEQGDQRVAEGDRRLAAMVGRR
jgi:predicted RNA-binding Zn-ribbon protein involved in translation (DUF1610 family)